MITLPKIEANPPAPPSNRGGGPAHSDSRPASQPVEAVGRALATQRDALFFRSQAILRLGAPAQAPYLAQQIGQLWPSPPTASHKAVLSAYQKNSPGQDDGTHRQASLYA